MLDFDSLGSILEKILKYCHIQFINNGQDVLHLSSAYSSGLTNSH